MCVYFPSFFSCLFDGGECLHSQRNVTNWFKIAENFYEINFDNIEFIVFCKLI